MSKKKNTLKDLDEFLKQQAAVLVQPASLSDQIEEPAPAVASAKEISAETILQDLQTLSQQEGRAFRRKFYDLIVRSVESQSQSEPEDKMLINTALFLKSGDSWKEVIRNYWKNK